MPRIISNEVHERRHRVLIDRHELKRIIAGAVAKELGLDLDVPGLEMAFQFKDETEGSPGYKVGVGVVVDVTERLTADS